MPPGAGQVFVINSMAHAGAGRGFDLDGACDAPGECWDNTLSVVGSIFNDQVRQRALAGEHRLLLELARDGEGELGTLKIYEAVDADQPRDPANDFKIPPGYTSCCEFAVEARSLIGTPPRAAANMSVRVRGDHVRSVSVASLPTFEVFGPLERAIVTARITRGGKELADGMIGGVAPIADLATRANPYCQTVSPHCPMQLPGTLLDLYFNLSIRPDVDLDGDGLEQLVDSDGDGHFDVCLDGCIGACASAQRVAPAIPGDAGSCALSPQIADGFSTTIVFSAVRASIAGIR